jgi:hypothetical protein
MEQINEHLAFIRNELASVPEMQFAEQQIVNLPKSHSDSFALERVSSEFFRQLDIICIVVQCAAKYMDRTADFTLEPTISIIGYKVRQLRENFVKQ